MSSIYFLADDDAGALRFVGHYEDLMEAEHVLAHDMITVPHLTSLPDLAEKLPVTIDVSVSTSIWPPMPEDPEGDLSWMAEPSIERIADLLRDRLAAIHPDTVPAILEDWSAELSGSVDEGFVGPLAADLIRLARRGRDRHLTLYNWYEF